MTHTEIETLTTGGPTTAFRPPHAAHKGHALILADAADSPTTDHVDCDCPAHAESVIDPCHATVRPPTVYVGNELYNRPQSLSSPREEARSTGRTAAPVSSDDGARLVQERIIARDRTASRTEKASDDRALRLSMMRLREAGREFGWLEAERLLRAMGIQRSADIVGGARRSLTPLCSVCGEYMTKVEATAAEPDTNSPAMEACWTCCGEPKFITPVAPEEDDHRKR